MKQSALCGLHLAALLCLAACAPQSATRRSAPDYGGGVTLSAELSDKEPPTTKLVEIVAIVRNDGASPISFTTGGFGVILIAGGEARLCMPPAAFQPMVLQTQPAGRFVHKLTIFPSFWRELRELSPGRYRMRVCYRRPGTLFFRATLDREPDIVKDGVVWSLDSDEIEVTLR